MGISAAGDCPQSGSGVSQETQRQDDPELAIRLELAKAAASCATQVVISLVEAVSPMDPKYGNICGSNKDPMALWEGFYLGMYDTMVQEVLSDEAPKARPPRPVVDVPTPKRAPMARPLRPRSNGGGVWSTRFDEQQPKQ